jgi:hypothetical protein
LGAHGVGFGAQVGEFFAELVKPGDAGRVGFLGEGGSS